LPSQGINSFLYQQTLIALQNVLHIVQGKPTGGDGVVGHDRDLRCVYVGRHKLALGKIRGDRSDGDFAAANGARAQAIHEERCTAVKGRENVEQTR
jgi:hypothetical protein